MDDEQTGRFAEIVSLFPERDLTDTDAAPAKIDGQESLL